MIAYYDDLYDVLRFVRCNDAACAGLDESFALVDDAGGGDVGSFVSLTLGSDGLPVMSYHLRSTYGDLRVARCGSLSCL